jgi:hypothetical protein
MREALTHSSIWADAPIVGNTVAAQDGVLHHKIGAIGGHRC